MLWHLLRKFLSFYFCRGNLEIVLEASHWSTRAGVGLPGSDSPLLARALWLSKDISPLGVQFSFIKQWGSWSLSHSVQDDMIVKCLAQGTVHGKFSKVGHPARAPWTRMEKGSLGLQCRVKTDSSFTKFLLFCYPSTWSVLTSLILTATLVVSCAHFDKSGNQGYAGVNSFLSSHSGMWLSQGTRAHRSVQNHEFHCLPWFPAVRGLDLLLGHETWPASAERMSAVTQTWRHRMYLLQCVLQFRPGYVRGSGGLHVPPQML